MHIKANWLYLLEGQSTEQTYDPDWPRLDLEQLTRPQTFGYFQFDAEDIRLLSQMLGLPDKIIVLPSRNTISGEEGLCMLLRRKSNRICTTMAPLQMRLQLSHVTEMAPTDEAALISCD
jgi:hypothetical protein